MAIVPPFIHIILSAIPRDLLLYIHKKALIYEANSGTVERECENHVHRNERIRENGASENGIRLMD